MKTSQFLKNAHGYNVGVVGFCLFASLAYLAWVQVHQYVVSIPVSWHQPNLSCVEQQNDQDLGCLGTSYFLYAH